MGRRARRTLRMLLGPLVACAVWGIAEGVTALVFHADIEAWESPPPSPRGDVHVLQGNPYLIYEYPPGTFVDGGVTVHVNSLGLRGPEVAIPKPPGVRRFLTTGDSSIFGFGVHDDEVFSTVAAARLGPPVEAVCGAIPGYSTVQTLNLLHLRALATDPDLLVIGNLWSDNNFDSFVDRDVIATYAGWEGSITGRLERLVSWSPIYRVLDWRLRVSRRAAEIKKAGWMVRSGERAGPRRVAIDDYAENLDTLAHLALDRGKDVVFLLPANRFDLVTVGGASNERTVAWASYRSVMRDAAARLGAPLLDAPELFRASRLSAGELFQDEMHPTAAGHRILGEALAALLSSRGWPGGARLSTGRPGGPVPHYQDTWADVESSPLAAGSTGEPPPPPDGPVPPADTGRPPPGRASDSRNVHGVLTFAGYRGGTLYLDALPAAGATVVVGSARLDAPGEFALAIGDADVVSVRAFLDEGGDGIDPADRMWTFPPLAVEAGRSATVTLNLDQGTLQPAP